MKFDPRLSTLRGIGALSVFTAHAVSALTGVFLMAFLGWMGVGLFLALSIFLLMRGLDEHYDLRRYFLRRILRIWPIYWAACAFVFLFIDHSSFHLIANAAFIGIYLPNGQFDAAPWDTHYVLWTLQVEEAAYLTFPLIARMGLLMRRRLAYALVAFGGYYGVLGMLASHFWASTNFFVTHGYTLPFGWVSCYGAGLLAACGATFPRWTALLMAPNVFNYIPPLVGILLCLPFFISLLSHPPEMLRHRAGVLLGEASYALYAFHAGLLQILGWTGAVLSFPFACSVESMSRPRAFWVRIRGSL